MNEIVTVRGFLGNDVRLITTNQGLSIASFRLASTPRRYDRQRGEWVSGDTNWYTVNCFRTLAENVHQSLSKGDPVVVTGKLRIRPWENGGQRGTSVEVDADGLGLDLTFGTSRLSRNSKPIEETGQEFEGKADDASEWDHQANSNEAWDVEYAA